MLTKVIAKFNCWRITKDTAGTLVECSPVSGSNSEEDKAFWAATPSGKLELRIKNEVAAQHFEVGKNYLITIEQQP